MSAPGDAREGSADGAMARVGVASADWIEDIPPVPSGWKVTVSFTSAASARRDRQALSDLGYEVVGVGADRRPSAAWAHFLVPQALLEQRRAWWSSLAASADAVFCLAFGPVQSVLAPILRLHGSGHARPADPRG